MKRLLMLLLVSTAVFSQPMIFELKDCPSSMSYLDEGSAETFTTSFFYDANKRIIKIEGGVEFLNATISYSKSGDTAIITSIYEADDELGLESTTEIIKQLHDSKGRVSLELCYYDQILDAEINYSYNSDGDLIREVFKSSDYSDTTIYEWDMTELIVKCTQKGDDNEIWSYVEYKIDNNKRIIRGNFFECETICEKTGSYVIFNYDTPILRQSPKRIISAQKSGKIKTYTINGREVAGKMNIANSVLIRRHEGKSVTQLRMK